MRAFLGVEISPESKEPIGRWITDARAVLRRDFADLRSLRWVRPRSLHITLVFFGECDPSLWEPKSAILEELQRGLSSVKPFELRLAGIGAFPGWKRPRVLWVGVKRGGDALRELHSKLLGLFATEIPQALSREAVAITKRQLDLDRIRNETRLTPHVTIGRLRDRGRETRTDGARLRSVLDSVVDGENEGFGPAFRVDRLILFQSHLSPEGPEYRPWRSIALGEQA